MTTNDASVFLFSTTDNMVGDCFIDADGIIDTILCLFVCLFVWIGLFSIHAHCLLTSLAHKHPHTLTNAHTR